MPWPGLTDPELRIVFAAREAAWRGVPDAGLEPTRLWVPGFRLIPIKRLTRNDYNLATTVIT